MTAIPNSDDHRAFPEQRGQERFPISLPATAVISGEPYLVRVINVALGGAMFESSTAMTPGSQVIFRCGAIHVTATVAWQANGRAGVRFASKLDDRDILEQLSRDLAIAARREVKLRVIESGNA